MPIQSKVCLHILATLMLLGCSKQKSQLINAPDESKYNENVIYGSDDRYDIFEVSDPQLLSMAASTVALISNNKLSQGNNGSINITLSHYGERMGLCSDEPFYEQSTAAFCSGSLVGPDLVLTAGHCIRSQANCDTTSFVFGFAVSTPGVTPSSVPADNVYECAEVIHSEVEANGSDFAVVRLNRPVLDRQPLHLQRQSDATQGDSLVVIGHPSGLPTKIADGANVRSVASTYLVTNLDTYGGNSGSAVFNPITGDIVGVLVRGENDFVWNGSCRESNRCENGGCRGEDVTKISQAMSYIPELEDPVDDNPPVDEEPPSNEELVLSSEPQVSIPDSSTVGVQSTLQSNSAVAGRKVLVEVNITHTWSGDLVLTLASPSGKEVVLQSRKGGSSDNVQGTFGNDLISQDSLEALKNEPAGQWVLKVADRARLDVGKLESWKLIFK